LKQAWAKQKEALGRALVRGAFPYLEALILKGTVRAACGIAVDGDPVLHQDEVGKRTTRDGKAGLSAIAALAPWRRHETPEGSRGSTRRSLPQHGSPELQQTHICDGKASDRLHFGCTHQIIK
jgi:hypothetical protein